MTDSVSYYLISSDGKKHQISDATILVGRKSATCQFVIDNSEVSREHARLRVTAQGLEVKDLSSANGTFVGTQRVRTKRTLKDGDELKFGPITYTVKIEGKADLDETVVGLDINAQAETVAEKPVDSGPSVIDVMPSKQRLHPAWMDGQTPEHQETPPQAAESQGQESQGQKPVAKAEEQNVADEPAPEAPKPPAKEDIAAPQATPVPQQAAPQADIQEDIGQAGTIEVMPLKQNIPPAWRDDVPSETAMLSAEDLAKLNDEHANSFNDFNQQFDKQFDGPTLLILSGKEAGRPYRLHCSADICFWTIGKTTGQSPGEDEISISIDDYSVSNFHAKLVYRHGRWKVVDQMSTNHTYVNDEQHNAAFLSSGDFLRFGRVKARFLLPQEIPVEVEKPADAEEKKPALARVFKKLFKK